MWTRDKVLTETTVEANDKELEELIEEDPRQSSRQLAPQLSVTCVTV